MTDQTTRRAVLGIAAALAGAGVAAAQSPSGDPHPVQDKTLRRIVFGSCAKQSKDQPIWDAIIEAKPDLVILLGDNIYADTRDMNIMREKYAALAAKPGFKRLRESTPIVAIWDDHDFGEDDAGADYPMKEESRRIFCDFWGEPAGSARRTRDGIYAGYLFGPAGQRLQVIVPDLRWNRTPLVKADLGGTPYVRWATGQAIKGKPVPGPYVRIPDSSATMIGAKQWEWLDTQLAAPADMRILASSLQVVADFPGWEAWVNFAEDHQRLLETIRKRRADGLICISGDTHYAEVSRLDRNAPYPLWDVTSSGLTEVWPVLPPNSRRMGEAYRDQNFGVLDIDWLARRVTAEIRDVKGAVRLRQVIDLSTLRC
jgi:alkaline phosphatase D